MNINFPVISNYYSSINPLLREGVRQPKEITNESLSQNKNLDDPQSNDFKQKLTGWQRIALVIKGIAIFVLTLGFGFGLGLASRGLRQKISVWYDECKTGIRNLGAKSVPRELKEPDEPFREIPEATFFLSQARKEPTLYSPKKLEQGLSEVFKIAASFVNPEDKTTIFAISEKLAQSYIKKSEFTKAYQLRLRTARLIAPTDPFTNLHLALAQADPKLGLHLQPLDTYLFKNQSIVVHQREYEDKTKRLQIYAKLSHPARAQIQSSLDRIKTLPNELLKALPADFCKDITVTEVPLVYQGRISLNKNKWDGPFSTDLKKGFDIQFAQECVIDFKGVGKIKIGNSPNVRTAYNQLSIELDPSIPNHQASEKLIILFAALGLGAVASTSRPEDIERFKVMQLLRGYYPKEAYFFEREAKSFEESVVGLKACIEAKIPDMKAKFQKYLVDHPELMYQQEVYPGQFVWSIKGLANEVRKAGAIGLMQGVGHEYNSIEKNVKQVVSMLKAGALSTQDRFQAGIMAQGASTVKDIVSGGAESVFLRMVTKSMPKEIKMYALKGGMQILYDLDLIERVGYVYPDDCYGEKHPTKYQFRPNAVQLALKLEQTVFSASKYVDNEVCVRNRIPPQFIKAIRVNDDSEKGQLIDAIKLEGLVNKDGEGKERINGILLDQFIVTGDFKNEYWSN